MTMRRYIIQWSVLLTLPMIAITTYANVLCPASAPKGAVRFSAQDPRVLQGLSRRSQALYRFTSKCSIDHRTERPKSHQAKTSLCHVHALAELWNSNVPEPRHIDPYTFGFQVWLYQMGTDMDTILGNEIKHYRDLLDKVPPQGLLTKQGLRLFRDLSQGGQFETDFEFMKKYGYYTPEDRPQDLFSLHPQVVTEIYTLANKRILESYPTGITDQLIKENLRPVYDKVMDYAWNGKSIDELQSELEPSRQFVEKFELVSVDFSDTAEGRAEFLRLLKEFPLGAGVDRHAIVIAGYDDITKEFWIRDSALLYSYYKKDINEVFSKLRRYIYFKR